MNVNAFTSDINVSVEQIEKDLLDEVVKNLRRNNLAPQKAQQLAQEFLSHLPPQDFNHLVSILKEMGLTYKEAQGVYLKYAAVQEEMKSQEKLRAMANHIQNGQIEKAIELVKGGAQNA